MEKDVFIDLCSSFFVEKGFTKKGTNFTKSFRDLTILISLEKDRHLCGFRISVCYYATDFLSTSSNVGKVPQHMGSGFLSFDENQIDKGFFDLDNLQKDTLLETIKLNFEIFINNIQSLEDLISRIEHIPDFYILSQDVENYIKSKGVRLPRKVKSRTESLMQRFLGWLGL